MTRKLVSSGSPYEPTVGFSRAVRVGSTVAVAGTAPIGPDRRPYAPGDAKAQTRRCFEIIRDALEEAGASLADVVRTRMYLTHMKEDWRVVAEAHGEFFADVRPAATMVEVAGLIDPEWRVEIEADAIAPDGGGVPDGSVGGRSG
jgi:enamine deaminase RidA (YjgF/YER057c/UK114 family)